jgi:hypothetical protein
LKGCAKWLSNRENPTQVCQLCLYSKQSWLT